MRITRRRALALCVAAAAGAGGAVVAGRSLAGPGDSPNSGGALRIRGVDLSTLARVERAGHTFTDGGAVRPVEQILAARGATHARLRLWVNPDPDDDQAVVLGLARRAVAAGLRIYLDLHYCDTWADPRNQATPQAWQGQSLATLEQTVHDYTRSVVRAFADQGTAVDLIQIGNEVTNGMLWPVGQVYRDGGQRWEPFTRLLRAGIEASRGGGAREVVVHIDPGGDNAASRRFFDQIRSAQLDVDTLAVSYYPFWNGSLRLLAANLNDLADRYGKDVLIAETAYPWTLDDADGTTNVASRRDQLPDGDALAPDPAGQRLYYERLRAVLTSVPGGRGAGFAVWEPAWPAGVALAGGVGNPYDNLGLFDRHGAALPAVDCVRAS